MSASVRRAVLEVALLVAMASAIVTSPRIAGAHADYERSEPQANAVLAQSPTRLDVWFTQELFRREGENQLVVTGPDGARVDSGDVLIDDADRTHMSVGLMPNLPPGTYTVAWQTLSAVDGDSANGTFTFTIDPSAQAPSPTSAPTEPASVSSPAGPSPTAGSEAPSDGDDDDVSFPWWALAAAGAIVGAGGIGAWALFATEPDDDGGRRSRP